MIRREQVQQDQREKLRKLLGILRKSNGFYQNRFAKAQTEPPTNSASLSEMLDRIQLLTKEDLVADQQAHPPHGTNLSFPPERYVRLHQTSGTSGKPLIWLDTAESWQWFLDGWADIYRTIGVTSEDRAFFAFSFGPFIGFWAAFEACRQLDVMALPGGALTTDQRLDAIIQHQATVLVCTPTYALRLAERAAERGMDLASSDVRLTLHAGEPGASIPAARVGWRPPGGLTVETTPGPPRSALGASRGAASSCTSTRASSSPNSSTRSPVTGSNPKKADNAENSYSPIWAGTEAPCCATEPAIWWTCGRPMNQGSCAFRAAFSLERMTWSSFGGSTSIHAPSKRSFATLSPRRPRPLTNIGSKCDGVRRWWELEMQIETQAKDTEAVARSLSEQLRSQLSLRVPVRVVPSQTLPRFELKAKRFFVEDS